MRKCTEYIKTQIIYKQRLKMGLKLNPKTHIQHFDGEMKKNLNFYAPTLLPLRSRRYKTFFMLNSPEHKFQLLIKAKLPTNKEVSCLKFLRCCLYHADKC